MAQLRRFFYCRLTLPFALTVLDRRIIAIRIDIARGGLGLGKSSPSIRKQASNRNQFLTSRRQKRQLISAVDHMSQGLCMYDGSERLMLCNKRYIEMYGFSNEVVRPGRTLLEVLEYRA